MATVLPFQRDGAAAADLSLMKRVAAADKHAQRVLAHRLAARVRRISQRLLSNRADADDASQLALMEILRSAATYKEISTIERWADRIAVRTVLRHAREQRKRLWQLGTLIDIEAVGGTPERAPNPENTPRPVEEYLAELPAARREVLVMKHSLGYTTEEIAELTDNPVGTVKDRLVAARKQLRKLIVRDMRSWGRGSGSQEGSRHD
ncbi:MAG TPA: sigma-70 family RNA polymerase sigma factor [Polyangiales bacterium]|nr:sigma-70 family RNA polymerase sigma factor [Polyangiales bacterium]